jgi:hypothetical protein
MELEDVKMIERRKIYIAKNTGHVPMAISNSIDMECENCRAELPNDIACCFITAGVDVLSDGYAYQFIGCKRGIVAPKLVTFSFEYDPTGLN